MMESAGHTAYDIQEKTGVQTSTIYRYLASDRSDLKPTTVKKIATLYGLTESQVRGDVPIEGLEIPAEKPELKDLLTLDEYQFISNIKNMDKEAREILYKLSSMLAEGSHAASPEKRLSNTEKSAFHPAGKRRDR